MSLRHFRNRNLLKQWNFRHHGVEDESELVTFLTLRRIFFHVPARESGGATAVQMQAADAIAERIARNYCKIGQHPVLALDAREPDQVDCVKPYDASESGPYFH